MSNVERTVVAACVRVMQWGQRIEADLIAIRDALSSPRFPPPSQVSVAALQPQALADQPGPLLPASFYGPIVEAIERQTTEIRAMRSLQKAVLDANKRLLAGVFGPEAGQSAGEDEIMDRARELVELHPGLKIEDALKRVRGAGVYAQ